MANGKIVYFLLGAALGVAGTRMARQGDARQLLAGLVTGSYTLKEMVLTGVETIKEDVEDYLAQARSDHDQHMQEKAQQAQAAPQTTTASSAAKTQKTASTKTGNKKTTAKKTAGK